MTSPDLDGGRQARSRPLKSQLSRRQNADFSTLARLENLGCPPPKEFRNTRAKPSSFKMRCGPSRRSWKARRRTWPPAPDDSLYDLYIANKNYSSWSLRPWVLMRELKIPFTEHSLVFGDAPSWEAYRKISPSGKVPCLMDGEIVVWDSCAIVDYLAEQIPAVWPTSRTARAWARSAAAEMHSGFADLRNCCSMSCGIRVRLRESPAGLERDIGRLGALWEDGLARFGGPYLAGGEFTAVDAFFAPVASASRPTDWRYARLPPDTQLDCCNWSRCARGTPMRSPKNSGIFLMKPRSEQWVPCFRTCDRADAAMASAGRSMQPLVRQQPALAFQAAAIARQRSVRTDNAVTGNQD